MSGQSTRTDTEATLGADFVSRKALIRWLYGPCADHRLVSGTNADKDSRKVGPLPLDGREVQVVEDLLGEHLMRVKARVSRVTEVMVALKVEDFVRRDLHGKPEHQAAARPKLEEAQTTLRAALVDGLHRRVVPATADDELRALRALRGDDLRVYERLAHLQPTAAGPHVCVDSASHFGCGAVVYARGPLREGRCRLCHKSPIVNHAKPGWLARPSREFDPLDRTVIYLRPCTSASTKSSITCNGVAEWRAGRGSPTTLCAACAAGAAREQRSRERRAA